MIKNEMMKVSYGIFKQAEKELADLKSTTPEFANIETELLTQADLLSLGEKDSKYISSMAKSSPDLEWITPSEISQRYPGFENIPENYIGWVSKEAGVVRVKNALNGFRILSQQNGADLRYNSKVSEISKNKVIWEDGNIYHSDHVVVAWGGYTTDYFDTTCTKSKVIQTETFWLSGNKGFPGCFIEASPEGEVYGLMEGQDLSDYKFGLHQERDLKKAMKWSRERFASKIKNLKYTTACMYTITDDGDFIYIKLIQMEYIIVMDWMEKVLSICLYMERLCMMVL